MDDGFHVALADFDEDSDVDGVDLSVCVGEMGRTNCSEATPCKCDLYQDGRVDAVDITFVWSRLSRMGLSYSSTRITTF